LSLPDLQFINRRIPIIEVAHALDLRIGDNGNLHCWRSHLHQNGDRTASVGIRKTNNTVKCFGCGVGPLGPVDLVMEILGLTNSGEAARWIAQRFQVPDLPPGKHLVQRVQRERRTPYGFESDMGLLIRSGLWPQLSPTARHLVPVLLEFAEQDTGKHTFTITMSYRAMARYAGVASPNAIASALRELQQIHWLTFQTGRREPGAGPARRTSTYVLTPQSDQLRELANATCAQMRSVIEIEKKLRAEARTERERTAY
jgi:hypothetical protein